jgi:SAM-dependent methyltransferase
MTDNPTTDELRDGYDAVAEEYIDRIFNELDHKPLDRELLDRFATRVGAGTCCDLGCGPGHVARYLRSRGANVVGIDLSPLMIERARQLNPGIEFRQGDMRLPSPDNEEWAGVVGFYSIIHVPREQVTSALENLRRSLRADGLLLISFHLGQGTTHMDEWWGKKVSLDFHFFERDEMEGYLRAAGFDIEETVERAPYEGFEYPSHRAYIFATRRREGNRH